MYSRLRHALDISVITSMRHQAKVPVRVQTLAWKFSIMRDIRIRTFLTFTQEIPEYIYIYIALDKVYAYQLPV